MAIGLVDVPIMFGNTAYEPDSDPNLNVGNNTLAQWEALLLKSFRNWPGGNAGSLVAAAYRQDSMIDPQRAYTSIVSDYGLTCAAVDIARASARRRRSPIYTFVNAWNPGTPIPTSNPNYFIKYSYHTWDMIAGLELWDGHDYTPTSTDIAHGAFLRAFWFQFMQTGDMTGTRWKRVDDDFDWPRTYNTFVISPDPYPMTIPIYRVEQCDMFRDQLGMRENFWWCD